MTGTPRPVSLVPTASSSSGVHPGGTSSTSAGQTAPAPGRPACLQDPAGYLQLRGGGQGKGVLESLNEGGAPLPQACGYSCSPDFWLFLGPAGTFRPRPRACAVPLLGSPPPEAPHPHLLSPPLCSLWPRRCHFKGDITRLRKAGGTWGSWRFWSARGL